MCYLLMKGQSAYVRRNRYINSQYISYNAIKDPNWYAVQVSDTTMLTKAASLFK